MIIKTSDEIDTFGMLEELLSQDQFELIMTDYKLRLVYLMNDAVESFLVFEQATMTGHYDATYDGPLDVILEKKEIQNDHENWQYVLVVRQNDTVVTLFFADLSLEVYLFDYSDIGHFWVSGYEYLRQLEYRLAILHNKYEYLGADFCTEQEEKMVVLSSFPPLSYCCYPAVPEKYIVPREDIWIPDEAGILLMMDYAKKAEDKKMLQMLLKYQKDPSIKRAKALAKLFRQNKHARIVDLIVNDLKNACSVYDSRIFELEEMKKYSILLDRAKNEKERLEAQGFKVDLLKEEPFMIAKDSIDFKVHLMVWQKGLINRHTKIITIEERGI